MINFKDIAKLYLYGTSTVPTDKASPELVRPDEATSTTSVNLAEYMDTGPGRFVSPQNFRIITAFFGSTSDAIPPGTYTEQEMRTFMRGDPEMFGFLPINAIEILPQVLYRDEVDDYAERVLIWNTTGFEIDDAAVFVVGQNGERSVENFRIIPFPSTENFDFNGGITSEIVEFLGFEHALDPSGIGRTVNILFDDDLSFTTLTMSNFDDKPAGRIVPPDPRLYSEVFDVAEQFFREGINRFDSEGRALVFGKSEGGEVSVADAINYLHESLVTRSGIQFVGTDAADTVNGTDRNTLYRTAGGNDVVSGGERIDEVYAGDGNDRVQTHEGSDIVYGEAGQDWIDGGTSDDQLFGGADNDTIFGGDDSDDLYGEDGDDVLFSGFSDGKSSLYGDNLIGGKGKDVLLGSDGGDLLVGGESLQLGDQDVDLLNGGDGYDTYYVNTGDIIIDSDGSGVVNFDGLRLTGGSKEPEDHDCNDEGDERTDGAQNESDDEEAYVGSAGETYEWGDGGLIVTYNGASINIQGWQDGDLGITLEEGDTENESPDCYASPIALDLDGDGVEITALSDSVAFFDIDGDGVRERTAWVAPDDGLLALDRDGNGAIEGAGELFGYQDGDNLSGFDRLAQLDDDGSGKIDANDAAWSDLRVWQDANGNGVSEAEELLALDEAGIAAISLQAEKVGETIADSLVTDRGTFTTVDGGEQEVLDVWFHFNQFDAQFDAPAEIDQAILDLPNIRGGGTVADLHIAMVEDPILRALVEEVVALEAADLGGLPGLVDDILYRWTGAGEVSAESRGENVDGRAVAVTEAFADQDFVQRGSSSPRPNAGGELMVQYDEIHRDLSLKLLAQTELGATVFPELSYEGNAFILLEEDTDSSTILQRISDTRPAEWDKAIAHTVTMLRLADAVYMSFDDVKAAGDDGAAYRAEIEAMMAELGVDGDYQSLIDMQIGNESDDSYVTSASYYGIRPNPTEQILTGGGDDFVQLSGGNNTLHWGEGQGSDTVSFRSHQNHTIRLRELTDDDFEISIDGSGANLDVIITLLSTGETLTLRDFGDVDPENGTITFAGDVILDDGSIVDLAVLQEGTSGDDNLGQVSNAELDGGAGDDVLNGLASLATDYVFGIGSDNDTIVDGFSTGDQPNRVLFGPGVTEEDVSFTIDPDSRDLVVTIIDTGETLTIPDQFSDAGTVIGEFIFEDGTTLDRADILFIANAQDTIRNVIEGSSNSDVLSGSDAVDHIFGNRGNDTIDGGAGDDYLAGGLGSDTLSGGDGDDVLEALFFGDIPSTANFYTEARRPNVLDGGDGDDTLIGYYGDDTLIGGAGSDFLAGDQGNDSYDAGAGDDVIYDDKGVDSYAFGVGDGADVVLYDQSFSDSDPDTVVFGDGISQDDVSFSFIELDPASYVVGDYPYREHRNLDGTLSDFIGFYAIGLGDTAWGIQATISTGESISLVNLGYNTEIGSELSFVFADGTSISAEAAAASIRAGTDADQTIVLSQQDDVGDGGAGDDTYINVGGSTTLILAPGGGQDTIMDARGDEIYGSDLSIQLADGLTAGDLLASRDALDLVLSLDDGSSIRVEGYFALEVQGSGRYGYLDTREPLEEVRLADGTTIDIESLLIPETDGNDVITTMPDGSVVSATPGDDRITGSLAGDTYAFTADMGNDTIVEGLGDFAYIIGDDDGESGPEPIDLSVLRDVEDTVSFADGIIISDLTGAIDGNDLIITHASSGATMRLVDQIAPDQSYGYLFNDIITNDYNDDVIAIPGLGPDFRVTAEAWDWLEQNYDGYGDYGDYGGGSGQSGSWGDSPVFATGIENFTFSDGSTLDRNEFLQLLFAPGAVEDDQTLMTGPLGGVLDGGAGDDVLLGGTGDDTFILGFAYDDDTIADAGGQDRLEIAAEIENRALAFSRDGNNLIIEIGGAERSAIVIQDQFAGNDRAVETIVLPDGTELSVEDIKRDLLNAASTEDGDIIADFAGDDSIRSRGGDDRIELTTGNDIVDGGAGRDTVVLAGTSDQYDIREVEDRTFVTNLTNGDVKELRSVEVIVFADDVGNEEVVSLAENTAPVASAGSALTAEDAPLKLFISDLLALASDVDGETLGLQSVGGAIGGTVEIADNNQIIFTPDADFNGDAGFDYVVVDGSGETATGRIDVTVEARNDAPVVGTALQDQSSPEDTAVSFALPADAFTDIDGDALNLTAQLANGDALPDWLVFDVAAGTFSGQPQANEAFDLRIMVVASDGMETSAQDFTLTITPVNDAPVATQGLVDVEVAEGETGSLLLPADLFTDVDGDFLALSAETADGTDLNDWIVFDPVLGTFAISPPDGAAGTYDIRVIARDGLAETDIPLQITVLPSNEAPELLSPLQDQSFDEDAAIQFVLPSDAFNDADGDVLSYSATLLDGTALPSWLSFDASTLAFTSQPPQDFNGQLTITVSASDSEFTVSDDFVLNIAPVNDAPVANDDDGFAVESTDQLTILAADLLANDDDVDGDDLTISGVAAIVGGQVVITDAGDIQFAADAGFEGTASFEYTISDGAGEQSSASAAVDVTAPPPDDALTVKLVALNDWFNPSWGGGYIATFDVTLTNDVVIDGSVRDWTLDAILTDVGDITGGWLDGYNAGITFDAANDTYSTIGQSYQLELIAGTTIRTSVKVDGSGYEDGDILFAFQDLDPVETPPTNSDPADHDCGLVVELVSFDDWYNPSWGGGYNATFDITLTDAALIGGSVEDWTLNAVLSDEGSITNGWMNGYNAGVTFDVATGVYSTLDQSYQLSLVDGSTLRVSVQVDGSSYDDGDLTFVFNDLDPLVASVTLSTDGYQDLHDYHPQNDNADLSADLVAMTDGLVNAFGADMFDFW